MLAVADEDAKRCNSLFSEHRVRDEEAAYCKYKYMDIEEGTINVHPKPE